MEQKKSLEEKRLEKWILKRHYADPATVVDLTERPKEVIQPRKKRPLKLLDDDEKAEIIK